MSLYNLESNGFTLQVHSYGDGKVQMFSAVVCLCEALPALVLVPILQAGSVLIPVSVTDVSLAQPVRSNRGAHFYRILLYMDQSAKDTQRKLSHR